VSQKQSISVLVIVDGKIDSRLLKAVSRLPNLLCLVLELCQIGDAELKRLVENLQQPEKLDVLKLSKTTLTDAGLEPLSKLSGLSGLKIEGSTITGGGLGKITSKKLRSLQLKDSRLDNQALKFIAERWGNSLVTLDLTGSRITDSGLRSLAAMPSLKVLSVGGTSVTPEGIRDFLAERNRLSVSSIENLGLGGFRWGKKELIVLNNLSEVSELDLSGWNLDDSDLEYLPFTKELITLNLSGTSITDEGMNLIGRIDTLQRLHLRGTQVTDAGLDVALEMPQTKFLEVGESEITFEGLMSEKFPSGKMQLDVSGMDLTVEQLRSLAQRRPGTEVFYHGRLFIE
ncbi:MAG: hypothetical protein KDA68_21585, partial [Planctomycetaceae bacterium]|nr:hypothetical protein [Planctomycetaceae bacterium]